MIVLGLNAFRGDSAAAVFSRGELVAAVEEERLNRVRHWAGLPAQAILECLKRADAAQVSHVAVSRNPGAGLVRRLLSMGAQPRTWKRLAFGGGAPSRSLRLGGALEQIGVALPRRVQVYAVEHHRAHMASAFFASPFEEAAVVSLDGCGDFSSLMWGTGTGNRIRVRGSVRFPHSLGVFYTAFAQFLGFTEYGDEHKLTALAAYGKPRFAPQMRRIVCAEGAACRLNLDFFVHHQAGAEPAWDGEEPRLAPVYSYKMIEEFGRPRLAGAGIEQRHADLAASAQSVLEECYFAILNEIHRRTKCRNLCLAGGVALNWAANGKIFEATPFEQIFIPPAAHDAGTAIGAALWVQHQVLGRPRSFVMRHAYYGPEFDEAEIRRELAGHGLPYDRLGEDHLALRAAEAIASGKIVGWFQGRTEFGRCALGNRSLLADPRRAEMKQLLNVRLRDRESFQPYHVSILSEATPDYFETSHPSPFMTMAFRIRASQRSRIPAVLHVDGTGRVQTVERDVNPLYWNLIRTFGELAGPPLLLNTSFTEDEPFVNSPREAVQCFLRTLMDVLVIGPFVLSKAENAPFSQVQGAAMRGAAF